MKAVIHQPMYFPYPGFFQKLSMSDVFVIMDDVQYDKRFTNRNFILDPNGPTRLTVPINKRQKFSPNMVVEINNTMPWAQYHWTKIHMCYANAKFFKLYSDYFESLYKKKWDLLFDLDFETVKKVMEWLNIKIPIIRESELKIGGEGTQRLINVCKAIGADTYISGRGGKNYMDERLFESNNIKLEYQNYTAIPYRQRFTKTFIPDLSIIDLIANLGPQSMDVISASQQATPLIQTTPAPIQGVQ
ncbi:MAG: WbqC family protein [Nitrososphaerota archaeon]|nr:WbqC family protein [Nitrososphaerota archaeon]